MANTEGKNTVMKLNEKVALTVVAATADVADTAEKFDFTPIKDGKYIIMINNVSALNGTVSVSIAAGDFWAAGSALTGTVAQGTTGVFEVESAKFKKSGGTMEVTVTPAAGKKLKTDHALTVAAVALV